jgi:hypothetical protein
MTVMDQHVPELRQLPECVFRGGPLLPRVGVFSIGSGASREPPASLFTGLTLPA